MTDGAEWLDQRAAEHGKKVTSIESDGNSLSSYIEDGGTFLFDGPISVEPIWGQDNEVLWAEGESLVIAGPTGVGKTTLTGQLVRARLGLSRELLGLPVQPSQSRVLYLAMDRPRQIRRSLLRQIHESERVTVEQRLAVWKGPPPADLAKSPGLLLELARQAGADTVIVDSLKDAYLGLKDDEATAGYNRARQMVLREGIQVVELHHLVKHGANGKPPTTLADIYGSTWITAGAGSVILLFGDAGDPVVQFKHLKQPVAEVGPWQLVHNHETGTTHVMQGADLLEMAKRFGRAGITANSAAMAMFGIDRPDKAQLEKARRKLDAMTRAGHLEKVAGQPGQPTLWRAT